MVVMPADHNKSYKNLKVKLKFLPIYDYELEVECTTTPRYRIKNLGNTGE